MNALQEKCRPKHQVLVLKCYPRTVKGAVDVKPNSSELSYLLFYAQSRRSKIQKVGSFLERKTASDVYRLRIGNVQVTLQIITALIEKTPKDLPLFASSVLKILEIVLKSNDITMVESSIKTFEAFCEHHDPTSLGGDQEYLRQYLSIVQQYASLASTRAIPGKLEPSKPLALRWRNSGLEAIRSIASSDALSAVTTQQYDVAVPMILENLWTDNENFLDVLQQRAEMGDKMGGPLLKRRTSVATVHTAGTEGDPNPIALAGSAGDVDKLAEEDIGVLAMQCLKQIFVAPNRSQIHAATVALLKFIQERVSQQEEVVRTDSDGRDSGWAIKMFLTVARWTPVADRFTILVTAMDTLSKCPLTDDSLGQHIVMAAMIASLLRSDINLIGLSVIDVLLQFTAHIRRLVQLPGDPNSMRSEPPLPGQPDPRSPTSQKFEDKVDRAAAERKNLLLRLQECIGDLATHVYYADQISDMISIILTKLKPARSNSNSGSPPSEPTPGSPTAGPGDEQHVDSLFALTVAKIAALRAIKSILLVANPKSKMSSNRSLSRNHVPMQVWDNTQWLLRDPDGLVRKAYVDAVVTWLERETSPSDSEAKDETARQSQKGSRESQAANLQRRAVSSASTWEKPTKSSRSQYLQLIHLAVYDNAVQFVDYETDIVLLHVLLAKLVSQLGVNAARYGIPMIFRLQEDIQDAETPIQKVRIGSLVHGYLWTLTEKFEFEDQEVGRLVHSEIVRRRSKNFWVEGVNIPPPILELTGTPGMARPQTRLPMKEIESEALLPFDDRDRLVDAVCTGYALQSISPPTSPVASPGRNFTYPMAGSSLGPIPTIETGHEIPAHFREQMMNDWTREAILAAVQNASKTASLAGSRTTASRLAAANGHSNAQGNGLRPDKVSPHGSRTNLRPSSSPGVRKSSVRSGRSPTTTASDAREQVTSVEQLKLVLSGQLQPPATSHGPSFQPQHDDSSSDSLVSYEFTPSELSFNPATGEPTGGALELGKVPTHPDRRSSNHEEGGYEATAVPPVPKIPSGIEGKVSKTSTQDFAATLPRPSTSKRSLKSRQVERALSSSWMDEKPPVMDLQALLNGIDIQGGDESFDSITKPPY
ncbi:hypothetical protein QBC42DRAFT_237802 [Cladorrhinum samala]|uniref:Protein EFR3 n=1 Tax=Cladorrhinum samala TaxID=585594 RepID=A0AAV9H7V0_9PEZI|nr:hypothetical protein QBC42DRAFT_237802 [Cladorrhinum samala]